jgi:hypothetical protein
MFAACRSTFERQVVNRLGSAFVIGLHSGDFGLEKRAECVTQVMGFHRAKMAERVGFEPDEIAPLNNLRPF